MRSKLLGKIIIDGVRATKKIIFSVLKVEDIKF